MNSNKGVTNKALVHEESYSLTTAELCGDPPSLLIFQVLKNAYPSKDKSVLQVELALQEALTNALEHGNLELPSAWREEIDSEGIDKYSREKRNRLEDENFADRPLELSITLIDDLLTVVLKDSGKGFDFRSHFDVDEDGTVKCHGRGMKLMNLVMDRVSYSDSGRVLQMDKLFQ